MRQKYHSKHSILELFKTRAISTKKPCPQLSLTVNKIHKYKYKMERLHSAMTQD